MNGLNPLAAAAIGSVLRFGLAAVFGYFVRKGIWTDAEASTYITAAVSGLLALGWGLYNKYKGRVKLLTALATPHPTTEAHVEQMVANGQAPPASLPKDRTPYLQEPSRGA